MISNHTLYIQENLPHGLLGHSGLYCSGFERSGPIFLSDTTQIVHDQFGYVRSRGAKNLQNSTQKKPYADKTNIVGALMLKLVEKSKKKHMQRILSHIIFLINYQTQIL